MTWQVPEISADFSEDFEDLLVNYLWNNWSITNPEKGASMKPNTTTETNKVSFNAGFPDYHRTYNVSCLQTITVPTEVFSGKSRYQFNTTVLVQLRMKRIERDAIAVDPQLGNMEREVERLVVQYKTDPQDIPGVKDLLFDNPITIQRIYDARDNFAKADWRSVVAIKMYYEKQNTSS